MMAILLSSAWFSGCSKHTIVKPAENITLDGMQEEYEHIPKPVSSIKPHIGEQDKAFDLYLKDTFSDIDSYKHQISQKLQDRNRYGKNSIEAPKKKDADKLSKKGESRLYPEMKEKSNIKHPIYREMR